MSCEEYKLKTKCFLERKMTECSMEIKKLKKKRKVIKILFISFITVSLTCSTVCATLSAFALPVFVIPMLSTVGTVATSFSLKFNLKGKKQEINKTLELLDRIKRKLDYVISCNGDLTEAECKQILSEISLN